MSQKSKWNDLSEKILINAQRYFDGIGDPRGIFAEVPRDCHWCATSSAIASPDETSDWWWFCLSCRRSWNLFEDLRRTLGGLSEIEASSWLKTNGVVSPKDSIRYRDISLRKQIAIEWFHEARRCLEPDGFPIPGEWGVCDKAEVFCFFVNQLKGGEKNWMAQRRERSALRLRRSIGGAPVKIELFFLARSVPTTLYSSIYFSKNSNSGSFMDGVVAGPEVHVITNDAFSEMSPEPKCRPLWIRPSEAKMLPTTEQLPGRSTFTLLSTERTSKKDILGNAFLLESPSSRIEIGGRKSLLSDFIIESGWWAGVFGFSFAVGHLSQSSVERLSARAGELTGRPQRECLEMIYRCSAPSAMGSPGGMNIRVFDGIAEKIDKSDKKQSWTQKNVSPRITNFGLQVLKADENKVWFELSRGTLRTEVVVSREIAEDADRLITELHAAARGAGMEALVVFRNPPYSKNLFFK